MIKIIIPGDPIAKIRPRFRKNSFTYDPQCKEKKTCKWKVKEILNNYYSHLSFPLKDAIECHFNFYFKPPNSFSKALKNLVSWGVYDHIFKPDIDNLLKFYLDVMNEIVYEDDRQITYASVKKYYNHKPRIEIIIMEKTNLLKEKVEKILGSFSNDEFCELAADLEVVSDCLCADFLESNDEAKYKLQLEAAYTLSVFADRYASVFNNIHKKYPSFWKEILNDKESIDLQERMECLLKSSYEK
jgi:Holliday junction resolvase RusA-like endonuclease